jgi:hypothetical protein
MLDAGSTVFFLITSPRLFGFADRIYWPHVMIGVFAPVVGAASPPKISDYSARTKDAADLGRPLAWPAPKFLGSAPNIRGSLFARSIKFKCAHAD